MLREAINEGLKEAMKSKDARRGDSGSAILERSTGKPVALLFAGDGQTTAACSFAGVCRHFRVSPV